MDGGIRISKICWGFCVFFYEGMVFIIYFLKIPALVKSKFRKNDNFIR